MGGGDRQRRTARCTAAQRSARRASRPHCGCGIRMPLRDCHRRRRLLRQARALAAPSIPFRWPALPACLRLLPPAAGDGPATGPPMPQRSAAQLSAWQLSCLVGAALTLGHCAGSDGEQQQDGQQGAGEAQRGAVTSGARRRRAGLAHGDGRRGGWNSGRRSRLPAALFTDDSAGRHEEQPPSDAPETAERMPARRGGRARGRCGQPEAVTTIHQQKEHAEDCCGAVISIVEASNSSLWLEIDVDGGLRVACFSLAFRMIIHACSR